MFRFVGSRLRAVAIASISCTSALALERSTVVGFSGDESIEKLAHTPPSPALSSSDFRAFRLVRRESVTADTSRLTFALPRENDELGLVVASLVLVQGPNLEEGAFQRRGVVGF
jgi:cytochrome-b5 reductase